MRMLSNQRLVWCALATLVLMIAEGATTPSAQTGYLHLNPVVEKLSQGKHVFGVSTSDLSLQNARSLARADIDYVYLDMEHNPMRFEQMEYFLAGLIDKAAVLRRGNAQARPAVFARFVPYGREEALWVIKHGLDIGLMGILVNNLETKEQAENVVRNMRFAQRRDSKIPHPAGLRGSGAGLASWFWGIPAGEYMQRADLWPHNPQGDLLFWPMIETPLGLQNADAIAQVPGVGGFYLGSGSDLSTSMGLESAEHPDARAAFRKILDICKARNLACGGTVDARDVAARMKDGYRIINFGGANGGLTEENATARAAALAAGAMR